MVLNFLRYVLLLQVRFNNRSTIRVLTTRSMTNNAYHKICKIDITDVKNS